MFKNVILQWGELPHAISTSFVFLTFFVFMSFPHNRHQRHYVLRCVYHLSVIVCVTFPSCGSGSVV